MSIGWVIMRSFRDIWHLMMEPSKGDNHSSSCSKVGGAAVGLVRAAANHSLSPTVPTTSISSSTCTHSPNDFVTQQVNEVAADLLLSQTVQLAPSYESIKDCFEGLISEETLIETLTFLLPLKSVKSVVLEDSGVRIFYQDGGSLFFLLKFTDTRLSNRYASIIDDLMRGMEVALQGEASFQREQFREMVNLAVCYFNGWINKSAFQEKLDELFEPITGLESGLVSLVRKEPEGVRVRYNPSKDFPEGKSSFLIKTQELQLSLQ